MTSGVLHAQFLDINPRMVLAFLQAALQFFVGSRSLLIVTLRPDSSFTIRKGLPHVVCMTNIPGSNMHDFALVEVKGHLTFFRPLDDLV